LGIFLTRHNIDLDRSELLKCTAGSGRLHAKAINAAVFLNLRTSSPRQKLDSTSCNCEQKEETKHRRTNNSLAQCRKYDSKPSLHLVLRNRTSTNASKSTVLSRRDDRECVRSKNKQPSHKGAGHRESLHTSRLKAQERRQIKARKRLQNPRSENKLILHIGGS